MNQTTIEHDPERRRITITIQGAHYDCLEAVANALKSLSWGGDDDTPESVFSLFLWGFVTDPLDNPALMGELIEDAVATGADGENAPEPLHSQRKAELRAAFVSAGLMPQ